ncbi:MAG: hypothetical protein QNJ05_07980 [Woeseiaceae bacterium]|nr:hypothetical protein [Woeseiaceae bacterium]
MKQTLLALLAISLAAGCTTTRTFHSIDLSTATLIKPGSTAIIELVDGSREEVEIVRYRESSLVVTASDKMSRGIDYADIRAIHAKQLDGKKTAGVVALAILAAGLATALGDAAFFPSTAPAL